MEFFIAWYSGNPLETFVFINRAFGPYWWAYWIMVSCNVITPQFIWSRKIRRSPIALFILSIFVNIGMWFERFVIVVTSLANDFLPSSWDYFTPTFWDFTTLIGSFGLFFTLFCLFVRYLPTVAMAEAKSVMAIASPHYHHGGGHGSHHDEGAKGRGATTRGKSGVMDSAHDDDASASDTSGSGQKVVVSGIEAITPTLKADAKDLDDDGPTKVERRQEMPVEPKAEAKTKQEPSAEGLTAPKLEVPKLEVPSLEVPSLEVPKVHAPPDELEVPKLDVPKLEVPKFEPPKLDPTPKAAPATKTDAPDANEDTAAPKGEGDKE
jgi:hypothetical protein